MFGQIQLVYFTAFLALLAPVLAEVYRMDFRGPSEIYDDDGFQPWDADGEGTVIQHVKGELGEEDPWVSTTTDYSVAKGGARSPSEVFVYYISENGITFVDTIKAFKDANEPHPKPSEKEWSVKGGISWDSIIKWDVIVRGKVIKTVTRDDWEEGDDDDRKRSVVPVRSVRFRA